MPPLPPQVDAAKLARVESICRSVLAASLPVYSEEVPLDKAKEISGLRAVFGEVYPDPVRVVSVGISVADLLANPKAEETNAQYSIEFCGECVCCARMQHSEIRLVKQLGSAG